MPTDRQLAAIMFTDIVGYTALMQKNEDEALATIKHYNATLGKWVTQFNGRVSNYYGDGSLCIFQSALDAINASLAIQNELKTEPVVPLRIGLHIGEIFFEEGKVLGDGVNVASRVQSLGQENTILISGEVYEKIKNNAAITTQSLGLFEFKNVSRPLEVFALTNEGLSVLNRKKMEGKLKAKKNKWRKPVFLFAGLALLSIIGFLVFQQWRSPHKNTAAERSIAVLPFIDLSKEKDQEYFGDGLAEEIINSLTTINELKVIGRTSSFQFKGKNIDLTEIGKKLNAGLLLEGSVQQSGKRVRITAQLIRAMDNSHIWSRQYDRELTDIFKIQDDIAVNITELLKISLSSLQKQQLTKDETDPETYDLYLKGLFAYREEKFEQSIDYLSRAIRADPDFALPYAYLALAKAWMITRRNDLRNTAALAEAKQFATKAIQLDSSLAEAFSALGLMAWRIERNFPKAYEYFERSMQLNPNPSLIKNRYAYFLTWMGDFEKAKMLANAAIQTDPLDYNGYFILINIYQNTRKTAEAARYIKEALKLFPSHNNFRLLAINNKFLEGNYSDVIQLCDSALARSESGKEALLSQLSVSHFRKGNRVQSDSALHALEKLSPGSHLNINFQTALVFLSRNQPDSAIARLSKAYDNLELSLNLLKISPYFDPIRQNPGFQRIYKGYGF